MMPVINPNDCVKFAEAIQQLGIPDEKVLASPICINGDVAAGLGDLPQVDLRRRLVAQHRPDRPLGAAVHRHPEGAGRRGSQIGDPWVLVGFGQMMTLAKWINAVGPDNLTTDAIVAEMKAFNGPLILGSPVLQCGKYPKAPGVCNDFTQFYKYNGDRRLGAGRRLRAVRPKGGPTDDTAHLPSVQPNHLTPASRSNRTMKDLALFILLGLGAGAVIAGIAMAVVITYSGSGIINLATGAVSMVAAYTFWAFKSDYFGVTLATVPAVVVTILVSVLVGVLSELLVFRQLRTSSPLAKLVASLGILLDLPGDGAAVVRFGGEADPQRLPNRHRHGVRHVDPGEQVLDGGDRGA